MGSETPSLSLVYSACVKLNTEGIEFHRLVSTGKRNLIHVLFFLNYFRASFPTVLGNGTNGKITN